MCQKFHKIYVYPWKFKHNVWSFPINPDPSNAPRVPSATISQDDQQAPFTWTTKSSQTSSQLENYRKIITDFCNTLRASTATIPKISHKISKDMLWNSDPYQILYAASSLHTYNKL